MEVFLTIAVMYGIAFGIKEAKLFSRPRQWLADRSLFMYQLLSCPYCVGFHAGWLTYLLLVPFTGDWAAFVRGFLGYAFAGVTTVGLIDTVVSRLEDEDQENEDEDSK